MALLILAGCAADDKEPGVRATHFKVGRSRADLVRELGEPSRVIDLSKTPQEQCVGAPTSALALQYDIPYSGVEARIREALGKRHGMTVVCVDKQGTVLAVNKVQF